MKSALLIRCILPALCMAVTFPATASRHAEAGGSLKLLTVAENAESLPVPESMECTIVTEVLEAPADAMPLPMPQGLPKNMNGIYGNPYSMTGRYPDWRRLWVNTSVLAGAFVGTLLVLECLPEDATSWNRAELQKVPLFKRWKQHVVREGPEWDHDKFYFNFLLHPYAGAVYYMSARSCGFNVWQSLLYCSIISNVGWEYGIEAFMERPSIQDLLITPLVGSAIGEGFYLLKRRIVKDGYCLFGSKVVGSIVAFLVDPVNEVINLFRGSDTRGLYQRKRRFDAKFSPAFGGGKTGFNLTLTF